MLEVPLGRFRRPRVRAGTLDVNKKVLPFLL